MARSPFKIWPTLRDAVIVFALQILGGVIADAATNGNDLDPSTVLTIVYLTKFLFGGIGFAISGCLAVGKRWHHLAYVACVVFGFGIGWEGVSLQHCVGVAALAFVNMLIGGGISFMIKSDSRIADHRSAAAGSYKTSNECTCEIKSGIDCGGCDCCYHCLGYCGESGK